MTSQDVAQFLGLTVSNSSELLRRYYRQGLLKRQRNYGVPKGYWYCLTEAGYERLIYLADLLDAESYYG